MSLAEDLFRIEEFVEEARRHGGLSELLREDAGLSQIPGSSAVLCDKSVHAARA